MDLILEDPYAAAQMLGLLFAAGGFGQLLRGAVGILKRRMEAKTEGKPFKPDYGLLVNSVVVGGLVGICGGVFLDSVDPKVLIPLGYAGADGIEGLFKRR